tara:strand:+ start:224 stop:430 length:207 start_codon:yes stop_codon:yes gene_type:complete
MLVFVFLTNLNKNLIKIKSTILAKIKDNSIKTKKYKTGLSDRKPKKEIKKELLYIKFKLSNIMKSNKK